MRGRILLLTMLCLAAMAACSKKDSIYIEPGRRDGSNAEPAKPAPKNPEPAKAPPSKEPAPSA